MAVSDLEVDLAVMGACEADVWGSGELGRVNSRFSLIPNLWGGLQ